MPTTLHRYTVTETPSVADAIAIAASTWPELTNDRAGLLRRVIEAGAAALDARHQEEIRRRRNALHANAGAVSGVYPAGALEALRAEWPA